MVLDNCDQLIMTLIVTSSTEKRERGGVERERGERERGEKERKREIEGEER